MHQALLPASSFSSQGVLGANSSSCTHRTCRLPQPLQKAMNQHLELYFQSEQTSDANVLDIYPMAIKRKVLRWGNVDSS